jgi:hypothetical protein
MHHTALMMALLLVVGCLASRPANAQSIGFEGVKPGMTRQEVAQLLAERGLPVTNRADGTIETKIIDASQQLPVTAIFVFQPQQNAAIGVEFQVTGPASNSKFLEWLSQQTRKWGNGKARSAEPTKLREDFCAGQNINVVVTLSQSTAAVAFFHSTNPFTYCAGEQATPTSPTVLFALPPVLANRVAAPVPVAPPRTVESDTNSDRTRCSDAQKCAAVNGIFAGIMRANPDLSATYEKRAVSLGLLASELDTKIGISSSQLASDALAYARKLDSASKAEGTEMLKADLPYCRSRGM